MDVEVVWIVAIVSGAAVLWRLFTPSRHGRREDPRELLARRYAAGEITEGEYLTKLSFLKDANELTP